MMNSILLAAGLTSVYFGYKLFCGVSGRAIRMMAGAFLAILGMAILAGEARAFVSQSKLLSPQFQRSPNWHNGSAPAPRVHSHREEIV
jgi:hypothetical protein